MECRNGCALVADDDDDGLFPEHVRAWSAFSAPGITPEDFPEASAPGGLVCPNRCSTWARSIQRDFVLMEIANGRHPGGDLDDVEARRGSGLLIYAGEVIMLRTRAKPRGST